MRVTLPWTAGSFWLAQASKLVQVDTGADRDVQQGDLLAQHLPGFHDLSQGLQRGLGHLQGTFGLQTVIMKFSKVIEIRGNAYLLVL